MAISYGQLDSLLGLSVTPQALAALSYVSGSASGSSIKTVSAQTGLAPYAAADSLKVTSVNDANNMIVVTATVSSGGDYGYGSAGATQVAYDFKVIGTSGNDLLLAANGAAATAAVSAASIAASITSGNSALLSSELFTLATDDKSLGAGVSTPVTLTFSALAPASVTVATALTMSQAGQLTGTATIADSAADLQANLDAVQSLAAGGHVATITLTDSATPTLSVTDAQLRSDSGVLQDIASAYSLTISAASAANAATDAAQAHVVTVAVSDSAANVTANLGALESLAAAGKLSAIVLTDSTIPTLSVTAAQLAADSQAIADISAPNGVILSIDATAANQTISGVSGLANVASFSQNAANYSVTAGANGSITVTDVSTGRSSTDSLTNVQQLQFADHSVTIETANSAGEDAALLYQAALNRNPDPAGLAYWTAQWSSQGALSVSAGFVNSAEFQAKYGALSNNNFVTQLYANVLDRSPDAAGFTYWTGQLSSGAETREQVLDGFAFSAEAITNATQGYTGQSGTHAAWLFLH